jgi:hypothetical protein
MALKPGDRVMVLTVYRYQLTDEVGRCSIPLGIVDHTYTNLFAQPSAIVQLEDVRVPLLQGHLAQLPLPKKANHEQLA